MAQLNDTTITGSLAVTDDVNFVKPLPVASGGTGSTSMDTIPTQGSTNPITSGAVYAAINDAITTVINTPF